MMAGAVGEVAELRLPQDQRLRATRRVAVLEAEHRELRQGLSQASNGACFVSSVASGRHGSPESVSNRIAWR